MGIRVRYPSTPASPLSPRIHLAPLPKNPRVLWGLNRRFDLTDIEDCVLELRAREILDEGCEILKKAVQQVSAASYEGHLKFSTNTQFGPLFGYNGETIQRLQTETQTKVKVADPKYSCTVHIVGQLT